MPEFREHSHDAICQFIKKHPLGMIAAVGDSGLVATHVPLLLDDDSTGLRLRGHVMRRTKHWDAFKSSGDVLVAFTGPDGPVLESWVEERPFGGTWNYMAAHVRGRINFLPERELVAILQELKDQYESDPATRFDRLPPDYVPSLINAIEGFEIIPTSLEAVFKLSQNRTQGDFDNIVKELAGTGGESALVAEEMIARRAIYFPAKVP